MAFIDKTPVTPRPAIDIVVDQMRDKAKNVLEHAQGFLGFVRNAVSEHTRVALATKLGGDAAVMLAIYNALKEAVDTGLDVDTDDIPA